MSSEKIPVHAMNLGYMTSTLCLMSTTLQKLVDTYELSETANNFFLELQLGALLATTILITDFQSQLEQEDGEHQLAYEVVVSQQMYDKFCDIYPEYLDIINNSFTVKG